MPSSSSLRTQAWLESPLRSPLGEIELAGLLRNEAWIDPARMRILRRFALVLVVEGRAYYRDDRGGARDLVPGDVIAIFPEIAHAYGGVGGSEWSQVYFVFSGPVFDLCRSRGLLDPARPVWRLGSPEYWRQRLAEIVSPEAAHRPGAPLRAMGRLLEVLLEMSAAESDASGPGSAEAWLEKSRQLLGDRQAAGWPAPQVVARAVGMNYENFRKRFVQLTGESPGRFQKRRRIDWACAAIYQGGHSLKEIADELGFCDVFHFSKAFKLQTGLTPSDYRRGMRGK
jgi:AraC-like DNA-binding protein